DGLEEEILENQDHHLRVKLGDVRRQAIILRRYIAPQRDVLSHLQAERFSWLSDPHRAQLREITDRITRYVEDLDAARERAAVTQDELTNRLSEQMNKTMYVLSLVAAVFLPLGLLTGLLGINVGGIPGTENHWAFAIVCVVLGVVAWFQIWLYRRKRLF
ncbi:MAG: CorA family divalent cation transporter, partial [bacterium]